MVAAGLLLLMLSNVALAANVGVAVDLTEIRVDQALDPGSAYQLPAIVVRNAGDVSTSYAMSAGGVETDDRLDPLDEWFRFEPADFELDPGETRQVEIHVALPEDADAGAYFGLLRAEVASDGVGALVGVAAAARLEFEVVERGDLGSIARSIAELVASWMPWSLILPLVAIAVALGRWVTRRFRIRVEAR
jgi:hypothetical protein